MDSIKTTSRISQYKYNRKIGMSVQNAAIASGYPRSSVERYLTKHPSVPTTLTGKTDMIALFDQKQMTDVKKVEHILEGMNATKVTRLETGETDSRGRPTYIEHTVPDWPARHKYAETMLKLCKLLDKASTEITNNTLVLNQDFSDRLKAARERATEERKASLVIPMDEINSSTTPPSQERAFTEATVI